MSNKHLYPAFCFALLAQVSTSAVAATPPPPNTPSFNMEVLSPLPQHDTAVAYDINNFGQVLGRSLLHGRSFPAASVIWQGGRTIVASDESTDRLGTELWSINDSMQTFGIPNDPRNAETQLIDVREYGKSPSPFRPASTVRGWDDIYQAILSNMGLLHGFASIATSDTTSGWIGFTYDTRARSLSTDLAHATVAVNDNGDMVRMNFGEGYDRDLWQYQLIRGQSTINLLPPSGYKFHGGGSGFIINNSGLIAKRVRSIANGDITRCVVYSPASSYQPVFPIANDSQFTTCLIRINNRGDMLISQYQYDADYVEISRSISLKTNGQIYNIPQLVTNPRGVTIKGVTQINDRGEIIGQGERNGRIVSFILHPKCSAESMPLAPLLPQPTIAPEIN